MLYSLMTLPDSLEIYISITSFDIITELEFMLCSVTFSWARVKAELFA